MRPASHFFCVLALFATVVDAAPTWREHGRTRGTTGNLSFSVPWRGRGDVRLQLAGEGQAPIDIRLSGVGCTIERDGRTLPNTRISLDALSRLPAGEVTLTLAIRHEQWGMYADGERVAVFPPPFEPPVTVFVDEKCDAGKARFQKIDSFRFDEAFMVDPEDKEPLRAWERIGGKWRIHSQLEDAIAQNTSDRLGSRPLEAVRSPNFFCLVGSGENGMILAGHAFQDNYRVKASIQTRPGTMGVVFHVRGPADYYALLLDVPEDESGVFALKLVRNSTRRSTEREVLAAAAVDLTYGQWLMPEVRVWSDRIECYLDRTLVFSVQEPLPLGGRYGLYVSAEEEDAPREGVDAMPITAEEIEARRKAERQALEARIADMLLLEAAIGGKRTVGVDDDLLELADEIMAPEVKPVRGPRVPMRGPVRGPGRGPARVAPPVPATPVEEEILDTRRGVRFDDFSAASIGDLPLDTGESLAFHARLMQGLTVNADGSLRTNAGPAPALMVAGDQGREPHVVSARFAPANGTSRVGLLVGWRGADRPCLQFTAERAAGKDTFSLVRGVPGKAPEEILASHTMTGSRTGDPFELMADASTQDELRLYYDGRLVLFDLLPREQTGGASGVVIGPGTEAVVSDVRCRAEREEISRNRYEKNLIYKTDPYMRHWSSPEGNWYSEEKTGHTWFKSDFFGRFSIHLPIVAKGRLHLGVREEADTGRYVVTIDGKTIRLLADGDDAKELASASLPEAAFQVKDESAYAVHCEDYWLWATSEGRLLFRHPLPQPLKGRRVRVEGFTTDDLTLSHVDRYGVRDYLFNEAPHDWTINGGRWQIINRFQCDPRWSHMNGQNALDVAAMWSKYQFEGDFCIEMYAGIRHGTWYDRCGDLNFTILNHDTTPSQGYTITCTGWDPNHSQMWTRLYRNGEVVEQSDMYLVPRIRADNVRLYLDPLIRDDRRPVHGAWYYLKLRRIGKRLQYWFDNQLVMTWDDEQPLGQGSAGIWTYMNSMMVARVKVAAERITVRPAVFRPLPDVTPPEPAAQEPKWDLHRSVACGDTPLQSMLPEAWEAVDPVGHAALSWHDEGDGSVRMEMVTRLGGGRMMAKARLPLIPCADIAGFRFRVKRTAKARFDFYYSIGSVATGEYVSTRTFCHRLCGSETAYGDFRHAGHTDVPAPSTDADWRDTEWTTVRAWLDDSRLGAALTDPDARVRIEGFGNMHPSYVMQGLRGNAPGAAYAVRDLSPITFDGPDLSPMAGGSDVRQYRLLDASGNTFVADAALSTVGAWLRKAQEPGLRELSLRVEDRDGHVASVPIAWLEQPPKPQLTSRWDGRLPAALVVSTASTHPDRRFSLAEFFIDGKVAPGEWRSSQERVVHFPRDRGILASTDAFPRIAIHCGNSREAEFLTPPAGAPFAPVLVTLGELTPFFENFESRTFGKYLSGERLNVRLGYSDPEQHTYLHVFNATYPGRLTSAFRTEASLSQFPVMQFRYRAAEMTNVNLALGQRLVYVNEPVPPDPPLRTDPVGGPAAAALRARRLARLAGLGAARPKPRKVRCAPDTLVEDQEHWHTWTGVVTDALAGRGVKASMFVPGTLTFGSFETNDQTGQYSHWELDDLVLGPAVSRPEQLAFTPHFFDFVEIAKAYVAVVPEDTPWHDLAQAARKSVAWRAIAHGERCVPDLADLPQGVCHLLVKAVNAGGIESPVTDVPFLHDTEPVRVTLAMGTSEEPALNGSVVRLDFDAGDGATLDLQSLEFTTDGHVCAALADRHSGGFNDDGTSLWINWPYLLREKLAGAADGDTIDLGVRGVVDGAGNATPDAALRIKVDRREDKRPPAFAPVPPSACLAWRTGWEAELDPDPLFTPSTYTDVELIQTPTEEPFVRMTVEQVYTKHTVVAPVAWSVDKFPYLSLRVRRPVIPEDDRMKLDAVLVTTSGVPLTIPLTEGGSDDRLMLLPIVDEWKAGQWMNITVRVRESTLEQDLAPVLGGRLDITKIAFRMAGARVGEQLDIQAACAHRTWRPGETLDLTPYDASGVREVRWQYTDASGHVLGEGKSAKPRLVPAALEVDPVAGGWLTVRAVDHAGNASLPLRFPHCATQVAQLDLPDPFQ